MFLVALEYTIHKIPNSYSYKYNYIKSRGKDIRAVAIGHSQFFDDFKSDVFYLPAFNLSNSAQGYMEDYYLLKELLPYMPNLKMVFIPIGYMSVGREEEFTQKSCFYHEYMNIDYEGQLPLKYRLECFDVGGSIKKVLLYYVRHRDIVQCDSLGWRGKKVSERKQPLGPSNVMDIYTLKDDAELFLAGEKYLNRIINILNENNIRLVLISPPYYWEHYSRTNKKQALWAKSYIANLRKENTNILYIDMEEDKDFVEDDFFDESHLNELGAAKFMSKLNDTLSVLN